MAAASAEDQEDWVCCDKCDRWLTFVDAGIKKAPKGKWFCSPACKTKAKQASTICCLGVNKNWLRCTSRANVAVGFCARHTAQLNEALEKTASTGRDPMLDEAKLYVCPLAKAFFNEPLKCACIHRLEQHALLRIVGHDRYREVDCPHRPCKAKWVLATARLDFDFQKRVIIWKKKNSAALPNLLAQLNLPTNRAEYAAAARKVIKNSSKGDAAEAQYVEDWIAWVAAREKGSSGVHRWEDEPMPVLPSERKENNLIDEVLCIVEPQEERETDYFCPLTQTFMLVPMTNGTCKHRMDRDSLAHLCKNDPELVVKCPTVGCVSHWRLRTAVVDKQMQLKIKQFLERRKMEKKPTSSPLKGSKQSEVEVIDLCGDDDDELPKPKSKRPRYVLSDID